MVELLISLENSKEISNHIFMSSYIITIFWFCLILIAFFINPLYSIAVSWFGLTLLGLNYFQKKNYSPIKKILFLRLLLILLLIAILVWATYFDYKYYPFPARKDTEVFKKELMAVFTDNIVYSTLIPLLFILNFVNLIYTSKQKYQYTKSIGMIEIAVVLIFIVVGFVYTFA